MTTHKQHFIPRAALLRRFSDTHGQNDNENSLFAYDKQEKRIIESCVSALGFENDLYEYPELPSNFIENEFAKEEAVWTCFLDKLENICKNPRNTNALILHGSDEKRMIKRIVSLQFHRTGSACRQLDEMFPDMNLPPKKLFTSIFNCMSEDSGKLFDEICNEMDENIFWFDYNLSSTPFIIGDIPVVLSSCEDQSEMLYGMPISPRLYVFIVEPHFKHYVEMRKFNNKVRRIDNAAYINLLNKRSYDNMERFIYYTPGYTLNFDDSDNFVSITKLQM